MLTSETLQLLREQVNSAQSILVIVSQTANFDQTASGIALFEGIRDLGKNVSLLSPTAVREELRQLVDVDKFSNEIGNKDLQISFPYQPDMVEKVSYNIDEEAKRFNLVIQPKHGTRPLSADGVKFDYIGADADFIFVIGVASLDSLDQLYIGYENLYQGTIVASIHSFETEFGTYKISTAGSASCAEVIAYLLQEVGAPQNADAATNLLAGIERATNSFSSLTTTADTLEIASKLLRAGARRIARPAMTSTISRNENFMNALAHTDKEKKIEVTQVTQTPVVEKTATTAKKKIKTPEPEIQQLTRMDGGGSLA